LIQTDYYFEFFTFFCVQGFDEIPFRHHD
jgi:hypothetical protein